MVQEADVEEGITGVSTTKPAGLASMETLDDSNGSAKHSHDDKGEDGLENVKLDTAEVHEFHPSSVSLHILFVKYCPT